MAARRAAGQLLLCNLVLATTLVGVAPPARAAEPTARVLLYHRVGDSRYPSTNVSLEAFRAQMAWLRSEGYSVVPTELLEPGRRQALPAKSVVIQFDDGYRSVYENAYPVLRELGYPFTVFLPTEAIDRDYGDYVTWAMVADMAAHGVTFGAHGVRHLRLGLPASGEDDAAYRRRIQKELVGSARTLAARGYPPRWVAYPYGEYNREVLEEAVKAGYVLGFSQDPGAIGPDSDPYRLPRFAVVGSLADMATFRERLTYEPLALKDLLPEPGILGSSAPEAFGAVVLEPGRYRPGIVNLFVSELGRLDATFDPRTGRVEAHHAGSLHRRLNRVLISLRDRDTGRYALGSWLILNGEGR